MPPRKRGLTDRRARVGGQILPVPVHRAVAVQGTGQARALELARVDVEIVLGEPGREAVGGEAVAEPAAGCDEVGVGIGPRAGGHEVRVGLGHGVGGERGIETGQPAADVRFDLALGPARLLEVGDVELLLPAEPREHLAGAGATRRGVRHAQQGDGVEDVRPEQRRVRGDRRAPVVPDDHRGTLAECLHHGRVVLHQLGHPVRHHRLRLRGAAVSAHVHGDRAVSRRGQHRQLVAPRVPGLREAVQQQDQGPAALLDEVDPAGGTGDQTVGAVRHVSSVRTAVR